MAILTLSEMLASANPAENEVARLFEKDPSDKAQTLPTNQHHEIHESSAAFLGPQLNPHLHFHTMALQMMNGLRRGGLMMASRSKTAPRWLSTGADAGDIIGIDLGTTNSCVSVMVSWRCFNH